MPMTQANLPDIRRLASNGAFSFTGHASQQIISRGISYDDVESILTSQTNQIIECQSPSCAPGKPHTNERVLVYDPQSRTDAIVVFCPLFLPTPEIRIVTVEIVDDTIWIRQNGQIPCLIRR